MRHSSIPFQFVRRCLGSPGERRSIGYHASIPYYGQITGADDSVECSWFIELGRRGWREDAYRCGERLPRFSVELRSGADPLSARSDEKRRRANRRRHQPHQAPGEGFFEGPAAELVPFRGIPRHDSASMVDVPPAITMAGGDRRSQCILQGAAFQRRIDAGYPYGVMGNRTGGHPQGHPAKDRTITGPHHHVPITAITA